MKAIPEASLDIDLPDELQTLWGKEDFESDEKLEDYQSSFPEDEGWAQAIDGPNNGYKDADGR